MIREENFGKDRDGRQATIYYLENKNGMRAGVINYGAALVQLHVPNQDGEVADVCLGFDDVQGYENNSGFLGVTVGPIANRTAGGKFELNGKEYQMDINDNQNNLHSHMEKGLHKVWYDAVKDESANSVTFTTACADGEIGLPGNRKISVTYTLTDENGLEIDYEAVTDADTYLNLTNHSYFNLGGHKKGEIFNQKLWLNSYFYTEVGPDGMRTGNLISVKGTPFDFTVAGAIGETIDADHDQIKGRGGYDHNFALNISGEKVEKIAELTDEEAGRTMEVYTDLPGVQFYTANFLDEPKGKEGTNYGKRSGVALETQYFPDSVNQKAFAKPIVSPDKPYKTTTIYKFK